MDSKDKYMLSNFGSKRQTEKINQKGALPETGDFPKKGGRGENFQV